MKIGIYQECSTQGLGGASCFVAMIAEALAIRHDVDVMQHDASLTVEALSDFTGTDLRGVHLRYIEPGPVEFGGSCNPWRRSRQDQAWRAEVSRGYDVFINCTHGVPPFCHAPVGVLVVLFPASDLQQQWPWKLEAAASLRSVARSRFYRWQWRRRLDTYQVKLAISEFARTWTHRRWLTDCDVLYPAVVPTVRPSSKDNVILSVGRFSMTGSKKQRELIQAFRSFEHMLPGWEHLSIGALKNDPASLVFYHELERLSAGSRARLLANAPRSAVEHHFGRARIFWHAAGFGEDEDMPERNEHFGISTVEAMAAGCVPIVINKGAQPELVQHGVSGFVWNSLDELRHYTALVARDPELQAALSTAARRRAEDFSLAAFVRRLEAQLGPWLDVSVLQREARA